MPTDAWITLIVLVAMIAVMVVDRFPTVVVMGSAVATLLFSDVIDERTALSGFQASAPATIAGLYVLAGAAAATGALGGVVEGVLKGRGKLPRLTATTAGLSATMPNTPLIALFAPRVVRWSRRSGDRASRFLLPMSYASVLGGIVTLIGTSTNLVVSDLLDREGHEPLSMFEITPVGLPVAVAGLTMICLAAPRLLRDRSAASESMREAARRFHVVMTVDEGGSLVGSTVAKGGLRNLDGLYLAAVERHGHVVAAPPHLELLAGDELFFVGDVARIMDLQDIDGLTSAENSHVLDTEQPGSQLYEAVISEQSSLVGRTLKDVGFRGKYHAAVLAVHRPSGEISGKLGEIELRPGDVLLVLAGPAFGPNWRNHFDFALVASVDEPPPPRRARAWVVTGVLVAMVASATLDILTLFEAAIGAAALVVIGGAISLGEARRAVNLNVVLTIALAISLGGAVETSGLAGEVASAITSVADAAGVVGQLTVVMVVTMLLAALVSNSGAAAVMLPASLAIAAEAGAEPRAFAFAVLVGASCSFLSPVGYQTNMMVYGLGGYRFTDFTKVGIPLSVIVVAVGTTTIWAFVL